MAGDVAGVVQHDVPGSVLERINLAITIADELFNLREQMGIGAATIKECDGVAAFHRMTHHIRANESRAAEDEDAKVLGAIGRIGGSKDLTPKWTQGEYARRRE